MLKEEANTESAHIFLSVNLLVTRDYKGKQMILQRRVKRIFVSFSHSLMWTVNFLSATVGIYQFKKTVSCGHKE